MKNEEKNHYSQLDSDRFGFKVAKIDDFGKSSNNISMLNDLRNSQYKLVICRVSSEKLELIHELEVFGFRIMDAQVTYKYDLLNFKNDLSHNGKVDVNLRSSNDEDIVPLVDMVGESFKKYGHYSADKKLDDIKCIEIYKDWAFRSLTDNSVADKVFVAEVGEEVAGFLSFKKYYHNGLSYAAGGMGAVAKKFRGHSIFKQIALKGLEWGVKEKLDWEEHNVLINNYSVNSSFSKMGFVIYKSFFTLHCWLD